MGEKNIYPNRCPICNGFGAWNNEPCSRCRDSVNKELKADASSGIIGLDDFKEVCAHYKSLNPSVYQMALMEGGERCKRPEDVPKNSRNEIVGIFKTRIRPDKKHLLDNWKSTYGTRQETHTERQYFGIIKDHYGYERHGL